MDVAVTIIYNGTTQKGENKAVSTIIFYKQTYGVIKQICNAPNENWWNNKRADIEELERHAQN